jgi:hypothetical protein
MHYLFRKWKLILPAYASCDAHSHKIIQATPNSFKKGETKCIGKKPPVGERWSDDKLTSTQY